MKNSKIPKIIHYCWFGKNEMPDSVVKCINSWKKYCPDYEIVKWDESNYNVEKNQFIANAYYNKKYSFVSDYARLDILYNYGGIYLDTDVELIKNIDDLLYNKMFFALEDAGIIATGLGFGSIAHQEILKKNMEKYDQISIKKEEKFKKIICTTYTTELLLERGMSLENKLQDLNDIIIYPTEYFCPMKVGQRKINITKNTYSIHHYDASWYKGNDFIREINYRLIPLKKIVKKYLLRRK